MTNPPESMAGGGTPEACGGNLSPGNARLPITLVQPSQKNQSSKHNKVVRIFRSVFHSLPILNSGCRLHNPIHWGSSNHDVHIHGATRSTGTLFGHRKAHVTLAFQENPRSLPVLLLEIAIPTAKFMQDMSSGLLRIVFESEKKATDKTKLLDEPLWTTFVNGRKIGYSTRRDPSDADLNIMQLLHAVSMGAGVLPGDMTDPVDGEMTYMRSHFDWVVGNRDSHTFYMLNPEGNGGSELSIFFVRI